MCFEMIAAISQESTGSITNMGTVAANTSETAGGLQSAGAATAVTEVPAAPAAEKSVPQTSVPQPAPKDTSIQISDTKDRGALDPNCKSVDNKITVENVREDKHLMVYGNDGWARDVLKVDSSGDVHASNWSGSGDWFKKESYYKMDGDGNFTNKSTGKIEAKLENGKMVGIDGKIKAFDNNGRLVNADTLTYSTQGPSEVVLINGKNIGLTRSADGRLKRKGYDTGYDMDDKGYIQKDGSKVGFYDKQSGNIYKIKDEEISKKKLMFDEKAVLVDKNFANSNQSLLSGMNYASSFAQITAGFLRVK